MSFTGTSAQEYPFKILLHHLSKGSQGALEISADEDRWVLYLEGGEIVFSRSSRRDEQFSKLRETAPEADNTALIQLQLSLRMLHLAGLRRASVRFSQGQRPDKRRSADTLQACWEGLCHGLTDGQMDELVADYMLDFPLLSQGATLSKLPLDDHLLDILQDLDGLRSMEEIVSFSPAEPGLLRRALALGIWLGVIEVDAEAGSQSQITGVGSDSLDGGPMLSAELLSDLTASESSADLGGSSDPFDDFLSPADSLADDAPDPFADDAPDPFADAGSPVNAAAADADPLALDLEALIAQEVQSAPAAKEPAAPTQEPVDESLQELQREWERVEASEDFFGVLNISWDDSNEIYRSAYFKLARDLHPDRWATASAEHQELAEQIFAKVTEAWEVLGEEETRKAYVDRTIHGIKSEDELAMEQVQAILAAETAFTTGLSHFRAGRIKEAHQIFEDCVAKVPENQEFVAYHGYTIYRLHAESDPERAEDGTAQLKQAIEFSSDQERKLDAGWVLLGMIYVNEENIDSARRCFIQALKINPSNPEATREMKRLQRTKQKEKKSSGWFSGLFNKKG